MKNINVFYWFDPNQKNFGDMLNHNIANLFGINPIQTSPENCEAVFIGSLLDDFLYRDIFKFSSKFKDTWNKPPLKIWGTGFIAEENAFIKRKMCLPETYFRRAEVFAVRGLYSRNRLEKILKQNLSNIPLGDPGLLASTLIDASEKKYKVGIIPHHLELSLPIWNTLQQNIKNSIIIDVSQNPLQTLKQISQCEIIISSALHGLIAADSFGIPNRRIIASNKLIGGDYKFNDYYSAFGIQKHKSIDMRAGISNLIDINQIKKEYEIDNKVVASIQEKLKMSFPFKN